MPGSITADDRTRRPFTREDAFRSYHVLDGALAPCLSYAVYVLRQTVGGGDAEKSVDRLWRVELENHKASPLMSDEESASAPAFSPDGRFLYFLSRTGDGAGRLRRIEQTTGNLVQLSSSDESVWCYSLSPDGRSLALAISRAPQAPSGPAKRIDRPFVRYDPYPLDLEQGAQSLILLDPDNANIRQLTEHDGVFSRLSWSPDSSELAAIAHGRRSHSYSPLLAEILLLRPGQPHRSILASEFVTDVFWTNDGQSLGVIGTTNGDLSRQSQVRLFERSSGAERVAPRLDGLAPQNWVQITSPALAAANKVQVLPDGNAIIVACTRGGETLPYELSLDEGIAPKAVVEGQRTCQVLDSRGGKLLMTRQDATAASSLRLVDILTGDEVQLTDHNQSLSGSILWPDLQRVIIESEPGVEIEGWILRPSLSGKPLPTLLYIHGGPFASFGYSYNEDALELAAAGYAVAFVNCRGSIGYGDAFSSAILGQWGDAELVDFNAFLDEAVAQGICDPDRIGVMGFSGGGHLSVWLIGHSDRFKAAVPEQGVYDMISMHGTSDARDVIEFMMGGQPHECPENYWKRSPLAYAHRSRTPTLLIQGETDVRCPLEQAQQLYSALRRNGCVAELIRLPDCNHLAHVAGKPALRRARMAAVLNWFATHLAVPSQSEPQS